MVPSIVFAIATLLIGLSASAAEIVARAEATELQRTNGKIVPRVVRDTDGHVTKLLLNEMELSSDDFVELGNLEYLRVLVLLGTNVTDEGLSHLKQCPNLIHLNLVRTDVTDCSVDTILELKQLKSVCLGGVIITPEAMARLKERNRQNDANHRLRWGYSQRKQPTAEDEQSPTRESAAKLDSNGK